MEQVERKSKIDMEKDNKKIVPDSEAPVWFAVVFDWETGEILATGVEDKKNTQ